MSLRPLLIAALLAVGSGAAGCGPPFVEGSLGSLLDLHFDNVWIESSSAEVGVRFAKDRNEGEDTILRVTAKLDGTELVPNILFDLAEEISDGSQRGTVSRNVVLDPDRTFPPIKRGTLLLRDVPGEAGSRVRGQFDVLFENGIEFASGHTVFATFQGRVP